MSNKIMDTMMLVALGGGLMLFELIARGVGVVIKVLHHDGEET